MSTEMQEGTSVPAGEHEAGRESQHQRHRKAISYDESGIGRCARERGDGEEPLRWEQVCQIQQRGDCRAAYESELNDRR